METEKINNQILDKMYKKGKAGNDYWVESREDFDKSMRPFVESFTEVFVPLLRPKTYKL